jgi:hypothetical protein
MMLRHYVIVIAMCIIATLVYKQAPISERQAARNKKWIAAVEASFRVEQERNKK